MRTSRYFKILGLTLGLALIGCSDDSGSTPAKDSGGADQSTETDSGGTQKDTGPAVDADPNADAFTGPSFVGTWKLTTEAFKPLRIAFYTHPDGWGVADVSTDGGTSFCRRYFEPWTYTNVKAQNDFTFKWTYTQDGCTVKKGDDSADIIVNTYNAGPPEEYVGKVSGGGLDGDTAHMEKCGDDWDVENPCGLTTGTGKPTRTP